MCIFQYANTHVTRTTSRPSSSDENGRDTGKAIPRRAESQEERENVTEGRKRRRNSDRCSRTALAARQNAPRWLDGHWLDCYDGFSHASRASLSRCIVDFIIYLNSINLLNNCHFSSRLQPLVDSRRTCRFLYSRRT